jgi:hypothetical protein
MKKFWEGLKDILYDSTDYFIMIAIVGMVVFIIGWRLDLLFANDPVDIKPTNDIIAEKDRPSDDNVVVLPPKEEPENGSPSDQTISISIPAGSLPSSIGSILETNGLVSSKSEFIQKSQDMKLDTKLKSGNYQIKADTPIEDIVILLTK